MYNRPVLFRGPLGIMLFIILVMLLFWWLFNSYRLGTFKKLKQGMGGKKRNGRLTLLIIALFIIAAALAAAAREPLLRS